MANRKTRRKEQKNTKKKVEEVEVKNTKDDIINKIIIALIVICFLGLFYLLTVYITNKHSEKDSSEEQESTEKAIDYEKILVGSTFSMSDADYIVVLYDPSNSTVADAISAYKSKESHVPIYYADMTNTFNKKYTTTEESNKNPTKASEISVNGPTLMRITNNGLVDYIEGEESIASYLG